MSWPCRHRPASSLKESLDPKPASYTIGLLRMALVMDTMLGPVEAI